MKNYRPIIGASGFLLAIVAITYFLGKLTVTELKQCMLTTIVLALVCSAIVYRLRQMGGTEKRKMIYFTGGSTVMTISFLALFVLFYLVDIHEYSFTYLALLIVSFVVLKIGLIRSLTQLP